MSSVSIIVIFPRRLPKPVSPHSCDDATSGPSTYTHHLFSTTILIHRGQTHGTPFLLPYYNI